MLSTWSWRSDSGCMKGWTHNLSKVTSKNSSQKFCSHFFFLFSSMLHVQPLLILTVWMKVHVSFIHCFHFYAGCAATKFLHVRPLQTRVLKCSSFILHDAFHNLYLSWSQFFLGTILSVSYSSLCWDSILVCFIYSYNIPTLFYSVIYYFIFQDIHLQK